MSSLQSVFLWKQDISVRMLHFHPFIYIWMFWVTIVIHTITPLYFLSYINMKQRFFSGFIPDESVHVTPEDYEGPLKSTWTKTDDWLLWLSWVFVVTFFVVIFAKSNVGQRIINAVMNFGVEHEHHFDWFILGKCTWLLCHKWLEFWWNYYLTNWNWFFFLNK